MAELVLRKLQLQVRLKSRPRSNIRRRPGFAASARAYAFVNSDGCVDETRSKGVGDANVAGAGNTYCFTGLAFTPKNVVVTPLESYRDFMTEMGVCRFRVVLSAANGFMVLINQRRCRSPRRPLSRVWGSSTRSAAGRSGRRR